MFKLIKFFLFLIIAGAVALAVWFLPKYNFIHQNPQYCVNLTNHLYYCGADSHIEQLYSIFNSTMSASDAQKKIQQSAQAAQKAFQGK